MLCRRLNVIYLVAIDRTTYHTCSTANSKDKQMRLSLIVLIVCFAFGIPVAAQAGAAPEKVIRLAQNGGKTLNEAVEQVRRQYKDGRIISAETKVSGGREVHHIRVMVDGKVKTVKVNGRSRG